MKVTVLSVTYNQFNSFSKLAESVIRQKEYLKEWVVFDDESTDGTVEYLKSLGKSKTIPLKVIYGKHDNKQLIVAKMNECMKRMDGGVFILAFGDTWLADNALEEISKTYIENSFGSAYRINVKLDGTFLSNDYRTSPANDVREMNSTPRGWQWLQGNGMITTKEIMERIDYIDESYPGYGMDDMDTAMRAKMNGAGLFMYNNVKVYHVDHPSKDSTPDNIDRYFARIHGLDMQYEGKKAALILNAMNMDIMSLHFLVEYKRTHPDFKVTLLNKYMDSDIEAGWIRMSNKEVPYSHELTDPYWLCKGDDIVVYGDIRDIVGSEFSRMRFNDNIKWRFV